MASLNGRAIEAAGTSLDCARLPLRRALAQLGRVERVDVEALLAGVAGVLEQLKVAQELLKAATRLAASEDDDGRTEG